MAIILNDNLQINAPKAIDARVQHYTISSRNAIDPNSRWAGMQVYVEDAGSGTSEWQYLNLTSEDDLSVNDSWVSLGSGTSPDLSLYPLLDGTRPFTGIQKGIEGVEPDDLVTLSQLEEKPVLSNWEYGTQTYYIPGSYQRRATNGTTIVSATPTSFEVSQDITSPVTTIPYSSLDFDPGESGWFDYIKMYEVIYDGEKFRTLVVDGYSSTVLGRLSSVDGYSWVFETVNSSSATTDIGYSSYGLSFYGNGVWFVCPYANLYYSTDGGLNWTQTSSTGLIDGVMSFATIDNGFLLIDGYGNIRRSTDGGVTWPIIVTYNDLFPGFAPANIVISGNIILIQGHYSEGNLRSTDGGDTWTLHSFVDSDSGSPIVVFNNNFYIFRYAVIEKSIDGINWVVETTPPFTFFSWGLYIDEDNILCTYSGNFLRQKFELKEYVLANGTTPFTAPQEGVEGTSPNHLATVSQLPSPVNTSEFIKKDGSTPFTGIQKGKDSEEDDDLTTQGWVKNYLNPTCPVPGWEYKHPVYLRSPIEIRGAGDTFIALYDNSDMYAPQIIISTDKGDTWSDGYLNDLLPVSSIDTNGNNLWMIVFNSPDTYGNLISKSLDNGDSWSEESLPDDNSYTIIRSNRLNTWIIASDGSGNILRSDDSGSNWTPILIDYSIGITGLETNGSGVWMSYGNSTQNNKFAMRSVDDGENWSTMSISNQGKLSSIATDNKNTWVATSLTTSTSIKITKDNGDTWSDYTLPSGVYSKVKTDCKGYWIVFGPNNDASYESFDNADTWSQVPPGYLESYSIASIGSNMEDTLIIAQSDEYATGYDFRKRQTFDCDRYVKDNGTTPFTSPQAGVPGTDPNHLATVSQIGISEAPQNGNAYIRKDGAWVDITTLFTMTPI